jgi:carbamoyl-phosphate synthase large subunit
MTGKTLAAQGVLREVIPHYFAVKEAVFPFVKFPGVDTILGPEMKSTGEVMGVGESFAEAFMKSQLAAGVKLPASGNVFISVRQSDRARAVEVGRTLSELGFALFGTRGTAAALSAAGLEVRPVNKMTEGRPHVVDLVKNGEIALIINTVEERRNAIQDSYYIRHAAVQGRVTYYTTIAEARAACVGMRHMTELRAYDLQGLHRQLAERAA